MQIHEYWERRATSDDVTIPNAKARFRNSMEQIATRLGLANQYGLIYRIASTYTHPLPYSAVITDDLPHHILKYKRLLMLSIFGLCPATYKLLETLTKKAAKAVPGNSD